MNERAQAARAAVQDITLRLPTEADAEAILQFYQQVGHESPWLTFGPEGPQQTVEEQRRILRRTRTDNNAFVVVAEREGRIIAHLNFMGGERVRTRHAGEFGIAVAAEAQGCGLGRRLMQVMLEWARAGGVVRKVNLRVHPENARAIALYRSLGFVDEGLLTRDLLVDGAFEDSLLMGLPVG